MPGGIFLRYGLSKKGVPSHHTPLGCNLSPVPLGPDYLLSYGAESSRRPILHNSHIGANRY